MSIHTSSGPARMTQDRSVNDREFWYRAKVVVLLVALIGHFYITFDVTAPGRLNGDEGVYHRMIETFVRDGELTFWNGLEELPSRELRPYATKVLNERLVPQYPHIFVFLAAPLYLVMGIKALYVISAVSFIGSILLTFLFAQKVFRDKDLAINTCLILVFATFYWEYSQAAWPHALTVFLAVGAVYTCYLALDETRLQFSSLFAVLSGVLLGLGIGSRLDVVFIVPTLIMLVLMNHERWLRTAILVLLGLAPSLLLLAWTNDIKFGTWNPFSYGPQEWDGSVTRIQAYWTMAALGLMAIVALWAATRSSVQAWISEHMRLSIVLLVLILAVALLVPPMRALILKLADGFHTIVLDLRAMPIETGFGRDAFQRGPTGGVFTPFNGVKKALLQSCPYLVLIALPLVAVFTRPKDRSMLLVLFVAFLSFVLVFSFLKWHGGSPLHMRYILPGIPFAAILVAYAWRDLSDFVGGRGAVLLVGVGILCLMGFSVLVNDTADKDSAERVLLVLPLMFAFALLVLLTLFLLSRDRYRKVFAVATATMAVACFVWAGVVALIYDYPRTLVLRQLNAEIAALAKAHVEPNSLLFLPSFYPFSTYIETEGVRFAAPSFDNFEGFRELAEFHLAAGRPVYLFMDDYFRSNAERLGLLEGYTTTKLGEVRNREIHRVLPAP